MRKLNDKLVLFDDLGYIAVAWSTQEERRTLLSLPDSQESEGIPGLVLLPWHDDVNRVLSNIGYDTLLAARFLYVDHPKVEGQYEPMIHQLLTAAFVCLHNRAYILSDPRTGKTASMILAMDYLQRNRMVTGGWMIVTTVTTMYSVWKDSIEHTIPDARVVVAHQSTRKSALSTSADYYITNYDSARLDEKAFAAAIDDQRIGGVVIDELTHCGNVSSQRSKAFNRLLNGHKVPYVIGLTGSPGSNAEAIFGMCHLINPAKLPVRTKTAWMEMTTFIYGIAAWQRKNRKCAPQIFKEAMTPAIRFNKADLLDLPPVVTQTRKAGLDAQQKRMREEFVTYAIALATSGEKITATNGGVLLSKLLQVAQGFCNPNVNSGSDPVDIPHKDRTDTILDVIAETNRKVVIFNCFKHSMRQRLSELRTAGYTAELIDGSVSGKERGRILHDFQYEENPRILIAHPTCTAFGVELSAADTLIFDGPPMLGGFIYSQALERLSSSKQTADKISVVNIEASPEEHKAFRMLAEGKEFGDAVASLFEDFRQNA